MLNIPIRTTCCVTDWIGSVLISAVNPNRYDSLTSGVYTPSQQFNQKRHDTMLPKITLEQGLL